MRCLIFLNSVVEGWWSAIMLIRASSIGCRSSLTVETPVCWWSTGLVRCGTRICCRDGRRTEIALFEPYPGLMGKFHLLQTSQQYFMDLQKCCGTLIIIIFGNQVSITLKNFSFLNSQRHKILTFAFFLTQHVLHSYMYIIVFLFSLHLGG